MKNKIIGWIPVIIICLIIIVAVFESPALQHDFPRTQSKEFDTYFGEGNWRYDVCERRKHKDLGSLKSRRRGNGGYYDEWLIFPTAGDYDWFISNCAHKLNNSKYAWFSSKRRTEKESLWYEFLEITEEKICREIEKNLIKSYTFGEDAYIIIRCSAPTTDELDSLSDWLRYETDLQDLFNCDYMKFQLDISCSIKNKEDYLFDTCLEEFKDMEKWLLEEYSDSLDFHGFLGVRDSDKEYRVDYINGVKEMEE